MPNGLADSAVAFGSSLSHMVLKCHTVPEWAMTEELDRENTLDNGSTAAFIPQLLAFSLCYFNQHLLGSLWLIVGYLCCGRYQNMQ